MNKLQSAINEISIIDDMASSDQWLNKVHPLVKLCLTMTYIIFVVSFNKYDVFGVTSMLVYPFLMFQIGEISFKDSFRRLRIIMPLVCIVGIFNPFIDTQLITVWEGFSIREGVISMITLIMKGLLTVWASYILVATTTIEKICYAMRMLHIPKIFVTEIMLIYRYISLMLSQAHTMSDAYSLRAPGQKGIEYKVWGSFVGQLVLRSIDRADNVYNAMSLRGYNGEFYCEHIPVKLRDILLLVFWLAVFVLFRRFQVLSLIGGIFV